MRKGQVEIIGLMVIVVLILVISFIFLRFSMKVGNKDVIKESVEVTNLLNAVMKMTPCGSIMPRDSMVNIIKDCGNGDYCGMDCKEYVKKEVENVMKAYGKESYQFKIMKGGDEWLSIGSCGRDSFSSNYVNPSFVANLMLC